jgi:hypothetical protein
MGATQPQKRAFFGQYRGISRVFSRYWKVYGGWRAVLSSPYLHAAILLLIPTARIWTSTQWWQLPISVLPGLVSFTLGGYAMFLAFGEEKFKSKMAGSDNTYGPLLSISATFVHFILLQVFALAFAIIAEARPISALLQTFPVLGCYWLFQSHLRWIFGTIAWAVGFGTFLYSLTSLMAATFAIFRVTTWLEAFYRTEATKRIAHEPVEPTGVTTDPPGSTTDMDPSA